MSEQMQRIREHYGVPAQRGARIRFRGEEMVIIGATSAAMYPRAQHVATGETYTLHPTWEIEYPSTVGGGV